MDPEINKIPAKGRSRGQKLVIATALILAALAATYGTVYPKLQKREEIKRVAAKFGIEPAAVEAYQDRGFLYRLDQLDEIRLTPEVIDLLRKDGVSNIVIYDLIDRNDFDDEIEPWFDGQEYHAWVTAGFNFENYRLAKQHDLYLEEALLRAERKLLPNQPPNDVFDEVLRDYSREVSLVDPESRLFYHSCDFSDEEIRLLTSEFREKTAKKVAAQTKNKKTLLELLHTFEFGEPQLRLWLISIGEDAQKIKEQTGMSVVDYVTFNILNENDRDSERIWRAAGILAPEREKCEKYHIPLDTAHTALTNGVSIHEQVKAIKATQFLESYEKAQPYTQN